MAVNDRRLGVERSRYRNRQFLRQLDHLRLRSRTDHAATGDDHRPLGVAQGGKRVADAVHVGLGTKRRRTPVRPLHQRVELGRLLGDLAEMTLHAQVHRAGCARGRDPECLADQIRHARDMIDLRIEFGDGVELADVVDFLVGVAVARLRGWAAGDRDHLRTSHEAVA